jgi:hypothetical protein
MVSIIYEKFEMNIANKIVSYMIHPTAEAMSEYLVSVDLVCFDTDHNWFDWNKIRHREHHRGITYFIIHEDSEWCRGLARRWGRRWGSWWVWTRAWQGERDIILIYRINYKLSIRSEINTKNVLN